MTTYLADDYQAVAQAMKDITKSEITQRWALWYCDAESWCVINGKGSLDKCRGDAAPTVFLSKQEADTWLAGHSYGRAVVVKKYQEVP